MTEPGRLISLGQDEDLIDAQALLGVLRDVVKFGNVAERVQRT